MTGECQEILWYTLLAICSPAMVKCTHKSHLGEEGFISAHSSRVQFTVTAKSRPQELVQLVTLPVVREQREMVMLVIPTSPL